MNNIMDNIVVFIIIQTLLIATPIMITAVGACKTAKVHKRIQDIYESDL